MLNRRLTSSRHFDWLLSRVPFVYALCQLEIWNRLLNLPAKKRIVIDLIQREIQSTLVEGDRPACAANSSGLLAETKDCLGKCRCEALWMLAPNAGSRCFNKRSCIDYSQVCLPTSDCADSPALDKTAWLGLGSSD